MSNEANVARPSEKIARNLKGRPLLAPPVDIYENAEEFLLITDVPGVTEDKVNIHVDRGEMLIEAERVVEEAGSPLGREYRALDYRRSFVIPDSVNTEAIHAQLKNGVLAIHIPKASSARPRKIEVSTQT